MDKEKNSKIPKEGLSLYKNIGLNLDLLQKKKIIKKNKTFTAENNKNKRDKIYLSNLKFGQNLLIWLLKKSKYINNNKDLSTSKKRDNYPEENLEKKKISEKFKIIPGIDKLYHLTDQSINDILKSEQDKSEFSTPKNFNIFSNQELKKRLNNIYNSSIRPNKKLSIKDIKEEKAFRKKIEEAFRPLNLSSKLKNKSKNKIFNTKLVYKIPKKTIMINTYNNNNNFQDYLKLKNKNTETSDKNSKLLLINKNQINTSYKLYTQPNEDSKKVIIDDKNFVLKKLQKEPRNKRLNDNGIFKKKALTHDNLLDKKKYLRTSYYKGKKDKINNKTMGNMINNKKIQFLNKSSNVDRLLFKLENPYDTFEENVFSNRPGDRFISFKNQIIKQKNKTTKIFYDYKKELVLNEILMKRYVFKIYSDRNKKMSLY